MIEIFVRMMASPPEVTGPVNAGNPGGFSMLELAETVPRLVGGASRIDYPPLSQDDPRHLKPDIRLARDKLRWEPKAAEQTSVRMANTRASRAEAKKRVPRSPRTEQAGSNA
jgi:UDP-glucuronate decarboxylase